MTQVQDIKAIVGLGNPGSTYSYTPHNIGFLIVEQLAQQHNVSWTTDHNMEIATAIINDKKILLIKPQTYMNNSGEILKYLNKRGIRQENLLVIHDEIDFPFGKVTVKIDGSARGHNGLRSLISHGGQNFTRIRCGVGRPDNPEDVGDFVTSRFIQTPHEVDELIKKSIQIIEPLL